MSERFRSGCCGGEHCSMCGKSADHKVEETIFHDDPVQMRHPLTAYVCHDHFVQIMGAFGIALTEPLRNEEKLNDADNALRKASEQSYERLERFRRVSNQQADSGAGRVSAYDHALAGGKIGGRAVEAEESMKHDEQK